MNDNRLKSLSGQISRKSLSQQLQALQANGVIAFCSMQYRTGYPDFDTKQFFSPFYIEFHNNEGWLLYSSNSIRNDRMNNQQWNSFHIKKIVPKITCSFLVVPDEISQKESEKINAENYHKKITGSMFSAIDGVCYQTEIIGMIEDHAREIANGIKVMPIQLKEPKVFEMVAEHDFESVLFGCYRNDEHLKWILSTMRYNVRLNSRKGAVKDTYLVGQASSLILYNQQKHDIYKRFTLSGKVERADYDKMKLLNYPNLKEGREYLLYQLQTELTSPRISVDALIEKYKPSNWVQYSPVFISFHGEIEELECL